MPVDVLIVGAGVNSLVTATLLAKSGLKTLVLERLDHVAGCAATTEVAPGFRCTTLSHAMASDPELVASLGLRRHGLEILRPAARACAPAGDRALVLWPDRARAVEDIRRFSPHDAARSPPFLESVARISGVLRAVAAA